LTHAETTAEAGTMVIQQWWVMSLSLRASQRIDARIIDI